MSLNPSVKTVSLLIVTILMLCVLNPMTAQERSTVELVEQKQREQAYREAVLKRQREIAEVLQKRSQETNRSLQLKFKLPFNNNHFAEIMGFYRQSVSLPMVMNVKAIRKAGVNQEMRITLRTEDELPLWLALQETLDRFSEQTEEQLQYSISNGVVLVSSMRDRLVRKRFMDDGALASGVTFQKLELQLVDYRIASSDGISALKAWASQTEVPILVNEKALKNIGVSQGKIALVLKERPVVALEMILQQMEGESPKLGVMLYQGAVLVSSIDELSRSRIFRTDKSQASVAVFKRLARPVQLKQQKMTLPALLTALDEQAGINFLVNWEELKASGVSQDQLLTLTELPMAGDAILRLAFSMYDSNLSYYLKEGTVAIGTKQNIADLIKKD